MTLWRESVAALPFYLNATELQHYPNPNPASAPLVNGVLQVLPATNIVDRRLKGGSGRHHYPSRAAWLGTPDCYRFCNYSPSAQYYAYLAYLRGREGWYRASQRDAFSIQSASGS